jgi:biopolymer transport protein ExbD
MRRPKKIKIDHHSEFDLDLAPLLAVMVKLVPVLLVSSAFVQLMVVETELPQVVQQAIQQQEQKHDNVTNISLDADHQTGITITIKENGKERSEVVAMKDNAFDYATLHAKLIAFKQAHPEVFKIEINPGAKVPYKEIVKIMDEARRDSTVRFPVFDSKQGKTVQTDYMFPEVVFTNTMEG